LTGRPLQYLLNCKVFVLIHKLTTNLRLTLLNFNLALTCG